MTCKNCKNTYFHPGLPERMQTGKVDFCPECPERQGREFKGGFLIVETVHFDNYKRNKGNVSKSRVEMIKRRALAPDGKGEVVMKTRFGKITDKLAVPF